MPSWLYSCIGFTEVVYIAMTCQDRVICVVCDYIILVWCCIIEETVLFFNGFFCWICLLWCDGTECHQNHDIHLPSIIQESSRYFLYKYLVGFVQIWCLVFWFRVMLMCAIFRLDMFVCLIFFPDCFFLLEPLQSSFDVSWNVDVHFVALLIPSNVSTTYFLPSKSSNIL